MVALRSLLAIALLTPSVAGCGVLTGPSDTDRLEAARARWARSTMKDSYYGELSRSCYCMYPGAFPRLAVVVAGGTIIEAVDVESQQPVDPAVLASIPTVEDLFVLLETEIAGHAAEVRVRYDPDHGAPMEIFIDRIRQAIDDELFVTIHLLVDRPHVPPQG